MKKTSLIEKIVNFLKFPSRASLAKRLNRAQFIKAQIVITMYYLSLGVLVALMIPVATQWIEYCGMCILILPLAGLCYFLFLSTTANRLHDFDYSGWWALILFIPVLNALFFVGLCIRPGAKGKNKYGESSQIWVFANAREK